VTTYRRLLLILAPLLLSASGTYAQGIIDGTLRTSDGTPVAHAMISLEREQGKTVSEATTDAEK